MKFYPGIFNLSNLATEKNLVAGLLATPFGYLVTLVYGGVMNVLAMTALIMAIAYDWISGYYAAKRDNTYASAYGLQGIMRTLVVVTLPAFARVLDQVFMLPNILFFTVWGGIMLHTLNSFTANSYRAGWDRWIPNWAIDAVKSEIQAKIERSNQRKPSPGADIKDVEEKVAK